MEATLSATTARHRPITQGHRQLQGLPASQQSHGDLTFGSSRQGTEERAAVAEDLAVQGEQRVAQREPGLDRRTVRHQRRDHQRGLLPGLVDSIGGHHPPGNDASTSMNWCTRAPRGVCHSPSTVSTLPSVARTVLSGRPTAATRLPSARSSDSCQVGGLAPSPSTRMSARSVVGSRPTTTPASSRTPAMTTTRSVRRTRRATVMTKPGSMTVVAADDGLARRGLSASLVSGGAQQPTNRKTAQHLPAHRQVPRVGDPGQVGRRHPHRSGGECRPPRAAALVVV